MKVSDRVGEAVLLLELCEKVVGDPVFGAPDKMEGVLFIEF